MREVPPLDLVVMQERMLAVMVFESDSPLFSF